MRKSKYETHDQYQNRLHKAIQKAQQHNHNEWVKAFQHHDYRPDLKSYEDFMKLPNT